MSAAFMHDCVSLSLSPQAKQPTNATSSDGEFTYWILLTLHEYLELPLLNLKVEKRIMLGTKVMLDSKWPSTKVLFLD